MTQSRYVSMWSAYFEHLYIDYRLASISSIGTGMVNASGVANFFKQTYRRTGNHTLYIFLFQHIYRRFRREPLCHRDDVDAALGDEALFDVRSARHQLGARRPRRRRDADECENINQSINQSETDLYSATYTIHCPVALNMKLQDTTKYKITQMQV